MKKSILQNSRYNMIDQIISQPTLAPYLFPFSSASLSPSPFTLSSGQWQHSSKLSHRKDFWWAWLGNSFIAQHEDERWPCVYWNQVNFTSGCLHCREGWISKFCWGNLLVVHLLLLGFYLLPLTPRPTKTYFKISIIMLYWRRKVRHKTKQIKDFRVLSERDGQQGK